MGGLSEIETAVAIRRDAQRQRIWLFTFGVLLAPVAADGLRQHFVQGFLRQWTAFDHHECRVVAFEIAVGDVVASDYLLDGLADEVDEILTEDEETVVTEGEDTGEEEDE